MKNYLSFIIFTLLFSFDVSAQKDGEAPLAKGDLQLNFGTGFTNWGLPVYVGLDIALHKDVTIEPEVQFNLDFYGNSSLGILFGADYHWNYLIGIPNNWDFYAGLQAGYAIFFNGYKGDQWNGLRFGLRVGGRWYWSERWGLHLELGGGSGYGAKFGLSVKL